MTIETGHETPTSQESSVLRKVRSMLLGIVALGITGTSVELTLLGHFEEPAQSIPLIVLAGCLAVIIWHFLSPTATSVRMTRVMMMLLIVTAIAGVGYHFLGNLEFKRELYPEFEGLELLVEAVTGVTPVFAPGSMLLLGFIGLTHTFRDPCLTGGRARAEKSGVQQLADARFPHAGAGK